MRKTRSNARKTATRRAAPRRASPARRRVSSSRGPRSRSQPALRIVLEQPASAPMMSAEGRLVSPVVPGKAKF